MYKDAGGYMKNKMKRICILIILLFFIVEILPPRIQYSSIFTTPGSTEIRLYVLMNTLLLVDEESLMRNIISEEQKINGMKDNSIYKLKLYRTRIHYLNDLEYDFLICDENGSIICDGNDSVL